MDCSLPGSSVCGILQAKRLEWVAFLFSMGSSPLRDWTHISCIGMRILYWLSHQGSPFLLLPATNLTKSSTDRKMKTEWCTSTLQCYLALNQNGIMPVTTAWMDRVNTILRSESTCRLIDHLKYLWFLFLGCIIVLSYDLSLWTCFKK